MATQRETKSSSLTRCITLLAAVKGGRRGGGRWELWGWGGGGMGEGGIIRGIFPQNRLAHLTFIPEKCLADLTVMTRVWKYFHKIMIITHF